MYRGYKADLLVIVFLIVTVSASITIADINPPSMQLLDFNPVTPGEYQEYIEGLRELSDPQMPFVPMGMSVPMTPGVIDDYDDELVELAIGLKNDPELIFMYVRNNINYSPGWGDLKGAYMTFMDGSGNSFDQSSLLIALLKIAGANTGIDYNPRYVYDDIRMDYDLMMQSLGFNYTQGWTQNAHYILSHIQIPIQYSSSDHTLTKSHIWVRYTIEEIDYELDPTLKLVADGPSSYSSGYSFKDGMDLDDIMTTNVGYTQNGVEGFVTKALEDAEVTPDFVQDVHKDNIEIKLNEYTHHL
ncbi:hypothetical protein KAR91_83215, partial [Candidatus Pacearchaeota archaeon]|nr:hypothetical protein [Candidatus Pacearchaeota archaeon]